MKKFKLIKYDNKKNTDIITYSVFNDNNNKYICRAYCISYKNELKEPVTFEVKNNKGQFDGWLAIPLIFKYRSIYSEHIKFLKDILFKVKFKLYI